MCARVFECGCVGLFVDLGSKVVMSVCVFTCVCLYAFVIVCFSVCVCV